ncbi:helix-turn-helix transcriptional regulator [Streptomyces murinus]|uniref:helix-turn-helix transcriptional regulator n=1 Tax=Streptomyces murinus TaxID=33900 RepID=UPI003829F7DD
MAARRSTGTVARRSTADILEAAVDVRAAAREATGSATGAAAVLDALSGVMEYDHASLTRWDPVRRRHTTLAGSYPDAATAYIETLLHRDPVFAVLRGPERDGLWLRDVAPRLLASSPGFRDVLRPLGITDGVAQCLFAADGRYVGMLNISTRPPRRAPDAARAVVTLLTESLAATVAAGTEVRPSDALPPDLRRLSARELEVLAELTSGRTNREIAERLYVTPRTVGTHVEHILAKLDLPNRAAAAARAAARGIEAAR